MCQEKKQYIDARALILVVEVCVCIGFPRHDTYAVNREVFLEANDTV